jgi:hypothetical protein
MHGSIYSKYIKVLLRAFFFVEYKTIWRLQEIYTYLDN